MTNADVNNAVSGLRFPILRMNPFHILRFRSQSELRRMSQNYFDAGDFKRNAILIDSAARQYVVVDVAKVRRSWNPLIQLGRRSPAILVNYVLGPPTQLQLDEIKQLVVDLVVRHRWYRQGHETEDEFRTAFMSFDSLSALMENISFYGKWQG